MKDADGERRPHGRAVGRWVNAWKCPGYVGIPAHQYHHQYRRVINRHTRKCQVQDPLHPLHARSIIGKPLYMRHTQQCMLEWWRYPVVGTQPKDTWIIFIATLLVFFDETRYNRGISIQYPDGHGDRALSGPMVQHEQSCWKGVSGRPPAACHREMQV